MSDASPHITADSASSGGAPARRRIHVLPEALINKIAAGEVVERPASVVKELLENAIDAGATHLAVAIEDGGRTLIRVADDGCGIPPDEAPLAFAQHATSKIATPDELFAISTMGFRGEALASIASVSHATLTTRTQHDAQATRIEVRDSVISPPVPAAAAVGTTLEVRDLFYSVPARRKFLRTDATEFGHIHEMVLRSALPNPHVAVTLTHNGRTVLELPATSDTRARVSAALGKELHEQLLPVDFDERGIRVTGFAGQPSLARATAKYQYVFLNGRFIRDRSILHAVKEAYRGLIEPSHQPVAVLFVEMDPAAFDVNVHPQKTEVRFRDQNAAYRSVLAAVREKLLESDLTPNVRTQGRTDDSRQGGFPAPTLTSPPALPGGADSRTGREVPHAPSHAPSETRQIIADFFKQATPVQPRLAFGPEPGQRAMPSPLDDPSRITAPSAECEVRSAQGGDAEAAPERPASAPAPDATPDDELAHSALRTPHSPRFIQLHNTYIVAETPDGVLIIDQHALHERIIYQELYTRATAGRLEGQRLLIPEVLPMTPRHQAALETLTPLLATLGIEVAPFDAQSVAVHTFPSLLSKVSPTEFLRELLDKMLELGNKLTSEELLHEVLDMASCKAAVKAGYPLSQEEIAALLARKEQVERSSNCPHGRPTTLRLTISDLERQFKRK